VEENLTLRKGLWTCRQRRDSPPPWRRSCWRSFGWRRPGPGGRGDGSWKRWGSARPATVTGWSGRRGTRSRMAADRGTRARGRQWPCRCRRWRPSRPAWVRSRSSDGSSSARCR
jgi:hypothetical protein